MTERGYTEPTTRAQRQRCTALRKNGTPCHNWADEEHDTTLCKIHLRAGPYSRAVPKGFRKQYERARQDLELLSATDETALLRVRISSLLERLTRADASDGRVAPDGCGWEGIWLESLARRQACLAPGHLTQSMRHAPASASCEFFGGIFPRLERQARLSFPRMRRAATARKFS